MTTPALDDLTEALVRAAPDLDGTGRAIVHAVYMEMSRHGALP
jgi:hypothetical protein